MFFVHASVILILVSKVNNLDVTCMKHVILELVHKYQIRYSQLLKTNMIDDENNSIVQLLIKYIQKEKYISINSIIFYDNLAKGIIVQGQLTIIVSGSDINRQILEEVLEKIQLSNSKLLLFLHMKTTVQELFSGVYIPLNSDVMVAQGNKEVIVTKVFHVHATRPLQMVRIGQWNAADGMKWVQLKMQDLQGLVINGAFIIEAPYVFGNVKNGIPEGYAMEFWKILQNRLNFSFSFQTPKDESYGSREADGHWSGILGMIINKRVDVGINLFNYAGYRVEFVSYLPPIFKSKVIVYIKQPGEEINNDPLTPFTLLMWGTVIGVMLLLVLALTIIFSISSTRGDLQSTFYQNLQVCFLYIFGVFCQQGQDASRWTWSCRLVFMTAHVTTMVLVAAYSATFISFLTVTRSHLPYTEFIDLLDDEKFELGVRAKSSHEDYFKMTNDRVIRQIYHKKMLSQIRPATFIEGLNLVCARRKYGFVLSEVTFWGLQQNVTCKIVTVPKAYYSATSSFVVSKGSPYEPLFRKELQKMRTAGIIKRIDKNFWPQRLKDTDESSPKSVELRMMDPFFVLLCCATLLSIVLLLIEIMFHRMNNIQKIQMNN